MCKLGLLTTLTVLAGASVGFAQSPDAVEAMLQQGRAQGIQYQEYRDNKAKDQARKSLDQAEKASAGAIAKRPDCEICWEQLAAARFYQALWGFSRNYDEFFDTAKKGLSGFPESLRLNYLLGYAHYNQQQWSDANRHLGAYLRSPKAETVAAGQVQQLLAASSSQFLTSWYKQADFYRSPESRLETVHPQTRQRYAYAQVTPEWEMQLGAQGFAALTQQARPLSDPETQVYVESLISKITRATTGPFASYKVTLLDSADVNAVTMPGHVIVHRGILAFVDSEAELAGILSHELAHNYGHHQARAYLKNTVAQNLAAGVAQAVNPQGLWQQLGMQAAAQMALQIFSRAYSRFEEKEADLYGAHLMYNAGYNPIEASAFFIKLNKAGDRGGPRFLRTHPPSAERAGYVADYVEGFPADGKEFRTGSPEFQKMKAKIGGPVAGNALSPR